MSLELPKRIFKEGVEPQVTQINNNCRIDYIVRKFTEWMPKELEVVKKDPVFSQIFKLHKNGLGFSARVVHSLLCRELVTYKLHELWFVFAMRPLQFSLQEFLAVTGFECNTRISFKEFEEWKYDGGFWSNVLRRKDATVTLFNLWNKDKEAVKKWKNAYRIRLIYLAIILCVVLARYEKANIPLKYIKVVMDLEKVRKYPWGVAAYDLLCNSIAKTRDNLKDKTTSYVLDGFSYAFQIWAMEAVPKIGKLCGKKLDKGFTKGPRCINWMGAGKVSYEEIIRLEQILTPEDDIYAYIDWGGNYDVVQADAFRRDDDVEDDRIKNLMELIRTGHDSSDHIWEIEEAPEVCSDLHDEAPVNDETAVNDESAGNDEATESDEDYHTPKGSKNLGATSRRGKKRLPDRGMEKRKHKVLSARPKQAPFSEDMKAFVAQLFEQSFSGMEQRLQRQMAETFEQMRKELKDSRKEANVEIGEPSAKKPSPKKPSPKKPSTSQPPLRRFTRREASQSTFDVNFNQADDFIPRIGTQGVEALSQTSYVPGFDPSQTKKEDEWWTPRTSVRDSIAPLPSHWEKLNKRKGLQLTDSPLRTDGSPQSSLYYCSEESWLGFTEWVKKPTPLPLGPSIFNLSIATRIVTPGKWLGNEEMDAVMFIWRVNTTLKRWAPSRVAFMNAMLCLQIHAAYNKFLPNKKTYELPDFFLGYGRGEFYLMG
ncbi:hypothetical protein DY000_02025935 [Brassica cretica]|uniref:DUF1985 domain-containing protein n=1 Tax=Brassica cretica TaxID=69181 RepID=A0ABQ7EFM8_BRACR|nr:hypothetical protein DY000_02025935 [Brassica cretica]